MKQDSDPRTARFSYYGYAYESYSTVPYPPSASSATPRRRTRLWTEDMNVNTNQQWCAIVKSKIGACRLFMGGEVDCFEGPPEIISISA
jgi:RAT1-interacting protein